MPKWKEIQPSCLCVKANILDFKKKKQKHTHNVLYFHYSKYCHLPEIRAYWTKVSSKMFISSYFSEPLFITFFKTRSAQVKNSCSADLLYLLHKFRQTVFSKALYMCCFLQKGLNYPTKIGSGINPHVYSKCSRFWMKYGNYES